MLVKGRKRKMLLGLVLFSIMGMVPTADANDNYKQALIVVDPGISKGSIKE